jgi:hypothetical protein
LAPDPAVPAGAAALAEAKPDAPEAARNNGINADKVSPAKRAAKGKRSDAAPFAKTKTGARKASPQAPDKAVKQTSPARRKLSAKPRKAPPKKERSGIIKKSPF